MDYKYFAILIYLIKRKGANVDNVNFGKFYKFKLILTFFSLKQYLITNYSKNNYIYNLKRLNPVVNKLVFNLLNSITANYTSNILSYIYIKKYLYYIFILYINLRTIRKHKILLIDNNFIRFINYYTTTIKRKKDINNILYSIIDYNYITFVFNFSTKHDNLLYRPLDKCFILNFFNDVFRTHLLPLNLLFLLKKQN